MEPALIYAPAISNGIVQGVVKRCVFKNDEIFEPVGRLKPLKIVLDVKLRVVSLFLGFEI